MQGGLSGGKLGSKPNEGGGRLFGKFGGGGLGRGGGGYGGGGYPQTVYQQGRPPKKLGGMGMALGGKMFFQFSKKVL